MIITGGKYKGQKIISPDEKITRPTLSKVRMAVFNTLQAMIDFDGKSFFDMFAGSGIMGLEAISRGFGELLVCEKNREVYKILKNNLKKYETDNKITSVLGDSLKYAQSLDKKFDVIYIDPPYFSGIYAPQRPASANSFTISQGKVHSSSYFSLTGFIFS